MRSTAVPTAVVHQSLESDTKTVRASGNIRSVARSADGTQIAFVDRASGRARLLIMPARGGEQPRELMASGYIDAVAPLIQNVAWMPDGRRLLVIRYDDELAGAKEQVQRPLWMWEVPVDGRPARRLGQVPMSTASGSFGGINNISVHPDGKQLAYMAHEGYVDQTWAIDNLAQFIRANAAN